MTIEELRKILASYKGAVSQRTNKAINEILSLSEEYSFLGSRFTFNSDASLSCQVNSILEQLIYELVEAALSSAQETSDDGDDAVLAMIDTSDLTARFRNHTDRLRSMLEVYIAATFANAVTRGGLKAGIESFLATSPTRFHHGRGVMADPRDAYTVLGQNAINTAFQSSTLNAYRKDGRITGYRVHRGSGYDCPDCDAVCSVVHPLNEQVLPVHYRCRCYTTPVYSND